MIKRGGRTFIATLCGAVLIIAVALPCIAQTLRDLCPSQDLRCKADFLLVLVAAGRIAEAERTATEVQAASAANGFDLSDVRSKLIMALINAITAGDATRSNAAQAALVAVTPVDQRTFISMYRFTTEAETYLFLGELTNALKAAREARRLLGQQPATVLRDAEAVRTLTVLGRVLLESGQSAEAAKVLLEGALLLPGVLSQASADPQLVAIAHYRAVQLFGDLAAAQLLLNKLPAARQSIANGRALANRSPLGDWNNRLSRLEAQAELSGAPTSAEAMRRARDALRNDVVGTQILDITEQLSASLGPGRVADLLDGTPGLLSVLPRESRIEIRARLAREFVRRGDVDGANRQFALAISLIEESRFQSKDSEFIPAFFSRYVDIYGEAVAALMNKASRNDQIVDDSLRRFGRTNSEVALRYAEAAHARQFSELYGASLMKGLGVASGVPSDVIALERKLRLEAGRAYRDGGLGIISDPLGARDAAEAANRVYLEFEENAYRNYPRYATLAFPRPVAPGKLPPELAGKFLVSYMVTDEATYWWVILDGKIVAFDRFTISRRELRLVVRAFVPDKVEDESPKLCDALVRGPFGEIARRSRGAMPPRAVVIPDDVLYALPWEALCGLQTHSLGEGFVISYAPSLTVLAQAVEAAPPASGRTALLVGNAQDAAISVPGFDRPFGAVKTESLASAISALRTVGYQETIVEHQAATPEAMLSRNLTPFALVHFDAHGFAGKLYPLPSLILHPSAGSPYGLLTMDDVTRMRLKARLVVLSACESALGKAGDPLPGEGVEALARVFMIAGAKGIVATLWSVNESAASALVANFYRELGSDGAPDVATALFRAKATVRAQFKYREHWASFILIGDPGN